MTTQFEDLLRSYKGPMAASLTEKMCFIGNMLREEHQRFLAGMTKAEREEYEEKSRIYREEAQRERARWEDIAEPPDLHGATVLEADSYGFTVRLDGKDYKLEVGGYDYEADWSVADAISP